MDEKITQLVNQVKSHLITIYGEKIRKVILYGSHARGEPTKDSDIDILVLIDNSIDPFEVRRSLSDLLFDILLMKKAEKFLTTAERALRIEEVSCQPNPDSFGIS